jgi:hypothetical protein
VEDIRIGTQQEDKHPREEHRAKELYLGALPVYHCDSQMVGSRGMPPRTKRTRKAGMGQSEIYMFFSKISAAPPDV